MEKDYNQEVERLLEAPFWVIDMLPQQVPQESQGQFFAVEKFYLRELRCETFRNLVPDARLRCQFADVLLKLNCYYGFVVNRASNDTWIRNPEPTKLYSWVIQSLEYGHLCVLIEEEDALITASSGNSCLTLYNPSERLLKLVGQLATAAGVFLWQPPRDTN